MLQTLTPYIKHIKGASLQVGSRGCCQTTSPTFQIQVHIIFGFLVFHFGLKWQQIEGQPQTLSKARQEVDTILSIHIAITQPLSRAYTEKRNNLLDLCIANVISCCHCQKQHPVMHYCNLPRRNKCFFISRAVKDLNKTPQILSASTIKHYR